MLLCTLKLRVVAIGECTVLYRAGATGIIIQSRHELVSESRHECQHLDNMTLILVVSGSCDVNIIFLRT